MLPGKALASAPHHPDLDSKVLGGAVWPSCPHQGSWAVSMKGPSPLHSRGLAVSLELLACSLQGVTWDTLPPPGVPGDLEVRGLCEVHG